MSELRDRLQGWAIDQLDGACTNVDDFMILVQQHSRDCVMSWRKFCWLFRLNKGVQRAHKGGWTAIAQESGGIYQHALRWIFISAEASSRFNSIFFLVIDQNTVLKILGSLQQIHGKEVGPHICRLAESKLKTSLPLQHCQQHCRRTYTPWSPGWSPCNWRGLGSRKTKIR